MVGNRLTKKIMILGISATKAKPHSVCSKETE
jgi:hypothetical protein